VRVLDYGMKQTLCFSVVSFAISTCILAAVPAIPERQSAERYEKMTEDWPFSVATPTAAPEKPVDGWWTNFYVGGIGKTYENNKEEVFVAISSKDKQISFSLFGNEPGHDGISIAGIEWNDNVGKSKVTLKKNNEFGTIGFDEMAVKTPAPPLPPQRPGGNPAIPGAPNANAARMLRPPTLNANPATPAVPRPTTVPPQLPQAVPVAPQPNQGADQTGGRPRVRVIRSNP
jgi:hypothetical protein